MPQRRGVHCDGRIRILIAQAATIAVGMVLGSCHRATPAASEPSSTVLRVGVAQSLLSATNPATGIRQLSQLLSVEGVVRVGEDGRFEPALADKWTVESGGRSLL